MRARPFLLLALTASVLEASGDRSLGPGAASAAGGALPALGTELGLLPPGPGKAVADAHCLRCHSSEIVRQQRLTANQWNAVVDKMVRWGSEVGEADRSALAAYLARHFGPDNDRFTPVETLPAPVR